MTRIIIADEMDLTRIGIQSVLNDSREYEVVGCFQGQPELLVGLRSLSAEVALISERLDPETDVVWLAEQVLAAKPFLKLLIMGISRSGLLIRDVLDNGARGYLHKGDMLQTCLPAAIHTVMKNRLYLSPTASAEYLVAMQSHQRNATMDDEARRVLQRLVQGQPIGQIAYDLNLSRRRVYWIRQKLRRHFAATTNEHLISRVVADGYSHATD
jgi:DNA-binding NarL/FixJ family response regulator